MTKAPRFACAATFLWLFASAVSAEENGWVSLFDGRTLDGWVQHNGTATYRVEDGAILGRTSEGSPNSFLCTTKDYSDLELEFQVKVDDQLNSGVQIHSVSKKEIKNGRVHGPQVERSSERGKDENTRTSGCIVARHAVGA